MEEVRQMISIALMECLPCFACTLHSVSFRHATLLRGCTMRSVPLSLFLKHTHTHTHTEWQVLLSTLSRPQGHVAKAHGIMVG